MHLCVQYLYIWLLGRALENDVVAEDQGRVADGRVLRFTPYSLDVADSGCVNVIFFCGTAEQCQLALPLCNIWHSCVISLFSTFVINS